MTQLYAQPYDISATGFFFETVEEYDQRAAALRNSYGQLVEEFEIQFIDGKSIDAELFEALGVHQGDIQAYMEATDSWSDDEKVRVIIALSEVGYDFALGKDLPSKFEDMDLYEIDSLRDLAIQFVEDGLFGDIAENIKCFLDFDAIGDYLGTDYCETTVAGTRYVYRCD
ncbi:antirestriction protein ArdA [bacterium]|nr:antirestriction protein ArdA [bacterium]